MKDQLLRAADKDGRELGFVSVVDGKIFVLLGAEPGTRVDSMEEAFALLRAPRCRRCGGPIGEACHNDEC